MKKVTSFLDKKLSTFVTLTKATRLGRPTVKNRLILVTVATFKETLEIMKRRRELKFT